MANTIGFVFSTAVTLLILNLQVAARIPLWLQTSIVIAVAVINMIVWKRMNPPPVSIREGLKQLVQGLLLVAGVALIDTAIGSAGGARPVVEAFFHTGVFGGVFDCFLFLVVALIGIPTLARSVWQHGHAVVNEENGVVSNDGPKPT